MKAIHAVILAAGASKRFGSENKLLVELDGVAILERVVCCIAHSGVGKTLVVTGADHEAITSLLSQYDVERIQNPKWTEGMGCSLALGVEQIDPLQHSGILVCLGDLPYLKVDTVQSVIERFKKLDGSRIVQPEYNERLGHPVVFPVSYYSKLVSLSGDRGAKSIIREENEYLERLSVDSSGVLRDVDRLDDLR